MVLPCYNYIILYIWQDIIQTIILCLTIASSKNCWALLVPFAFGDHVLWNTGITFPSDQRVLTRHCGCAIQAPATPNKQLPECKTRFMNRTLAWVSRCILAVSIGLWTRFMQFLWDTCLWCETYKTPSGDVQVCIRCPPLWWSLALWAFAQCAGGSSGKGRGLMEVVWCRQMEIQHGAGKGAQSVPTCPKQPASIPGDGAGIEWRVDISCHCVRRLSLYTDKHWPVILLAPATSCPIGGIRIRVCSSSLG